MAATDKRQLYGAGRTERLQALQLKDTLVSSHVLQDGEYNLKKGKTGWQTCFKSDFPGQALDRSHTIAAITHSKHNFHLGNDSGQRLPGHTYTQSTTRDDYGKKEAPRTQVLQEDRTVNWPDMAPQFMVKKDIGESEYSNNFMSQRSSSAPAFPLVDTCRMQLPLDPVRFHHQRGSRFQFGSDEKSHVSEQQRAFGRVSGAEDRTHKLPRDLKSDVGRKLKDAGNKSNVFRSGDYDNIVGGNHMETTTVSDFGPRTRDPAQLFASQILQQRMPNQTPSQPGRPRPTTDVANELTNYARSVTVPQVIKDAGDERNYQENAHFKLGFEPYQKESLYGKDYALAAMAARSAPQQHPTADAGQLFQNDPQFGGKAKSLKSTDYMKPPPQVKSVILENNLKKNAGNNIIMSYDKSRHTSDRQASLSHTDYSGPPAGYKPMPAMGERAVPYPFLETDVALPYPGLPRQSEATNQFAGALSNGMYALDRVRTRTDTCRDRLLDTKKTHFTVGYVGPDFSSHNSLNYMGKKKNDANLPPAGKIEPKSDADFLHLGHSGNTQDMRAADPHVTSKMEGLHARQQHLLPDGERAFGTSVMKSDYNPGQRLTSDQVRTVQKYERLLAKPFLRSHLFHTDNTGRDNMVSTTMDDFIQPDTMTGGRKMLVAK